MKGGGIFLIVVRSLMNRRGTVLLTMFSIALSVALLLGVEKIRIGATRGFESTISETDLIVGARSGSINLLLYSVFRIGDATANISWASYETFANRPDVAWTVPISLGDSHRGFRVVGTTAAYFERYKYASGTSLVFSAGEPFSDVFDTVVGAAVARELGYAIGDEVVLSHGVRSASFAEHKERPFRVTGILRPTGTPVDRSVHVSLEGIEAVHVGWETGGPSLRDRSKSAEDVRQADLAPKQVTAFLVGVKSKSGVLRFQRDINTYPDEALMAIIPGVALAQLWSVVAAAETALRAISALVVATGMIGMLTALLASLNERRREMAILRSVGASATDIFAVLMIESFLISFGGALAGAGTVSAAAAATGPIIEQRFGIPMAGYGVSSYDVMIICVVTLAGLALGVVPAWRAYRNSLSDGLMIRV